jgi:hypothetical protein
MWLLVILGDGRFAVKLPTLPLDGRHPATQGRWSDLRGRIQEHSLKEQDLA